MTVFQSNKILAGVLLAALVSSAGIHPLNAWSKGSKDGQKENQVEKSARQVSGMPVGLVPGNPPAYVWKPEGKPRAAVLCLHELGFYAGAFNDLGERLSKSGMIVYAMDERGFGGWQAMEANNKKDTRMDMDKIIQDTKDAAEVIKKLNPDTPLFLLGEAMGGAIVLKVAAAYPELITGIITAAPSGEHHNTTKNYTTIAAQLVKGGPTKNCSYGQDLLESATPREELRQAFRKDSNIRLDLAPRELMACQFFMYKTKQMARQIKNTPVLVVHGEKDGESKESGSQKIYDLLSTKDKNYIKLPDGDHYTYEDLKVSNAAFDQTLSWIDKHL